MSEFTPQEPKGAEFLDCGQFRVIIESPDALHGASSVVGENILAFKRFDSDDTVLCQSRFATGLDDTGVFNVSGHVMYADTAAKNGVYQPTDLFDYLVYHANLDMDTMRCSESNPSAVTHVNPDGLEITLDQEHFEVGPSRLTVRATTYTEDVGNRYQLIMDCLQFWGECHDLALKQDFDQSTSELRFLTI